jgi:hypothetical protein
MSFANGVRGDMGISPVGGVIPVRRGAMAGDVRASKLGQTSEVPLEDEST